MSCSTTAFLDERITQTKLLIVAYEDALLFLATANAVETYDLDTGQSRQRVTRSNMKELDETLSGLYNRLATMEARLTGCGVVVVGPAW